MPEGVTQDGLAVPIDEPSDGGAMVNCQLPDSGPLFCAELELLLPPPHPERIKLASNKADKHAPGIPQDMRDGLPRDSAVCTRSSSNLSMLSKS